MSGPATADHAETAAPIRPFPRPWAALAASVAAMPGPSSHRAGPRTGGLRRAAFSIELAQISPSTVSGTTCAVQPASPCARTSS